MIDVALNFIVQQLNSYAVSNSLTTGSSPFCNVGNISQLGTSTPPFDGQIMIGVVNIEEDRIAKSQEPYFRQGDVVYRGNPWIPINIYCLFSAVNSDYYSQALTAISGVVKFFQGQNVFTPSNSDLDPRIDKLIADMMLLNFDQLNQIWGYNGAKYYPSVVYKLRMVLIGNVPQAASGIITQINITEGN